MTFTVPAVFLCGQCLSLFCFIRAAHSLTCTLLPRGAQELQTSIFFASSLVFAAPSWVFPSVLHHGDKAESNLFLLNKMSVSERRSCLWLLHVRAHLSVFVRG